MNRQIVIEPKSTLKNGREISLYYIFKYL